MIHGEKSSGNHPYPGNAPEKLATKVVKRAFESLEKNIKKEMSSEEKILAFLEKALAKEMEAEAKKQQCELEPADYLRASVIYFDREMKTVVSYGNCNCRIGSNSIMHDENTKKLGDNGYKPQDGENIEEKTAKDKTKKETIKNHKSVIVYEGQKVILWTDDFPIRNEAAVIEANSYEGTYVEIW